MKSVICLLLTAGLLYSCSKKEATVENITGSAYIKYKVEGTQSQINKSTPNVYPLGHIQGVHYSSPGSAVGYTFLGQYSVSPATINADSKLISIAVGIDSMITGQTYVSGSPTLLVGVDLQDNNYFYFAKPQYAGTSFSIKLTSHQNGFVSGIFSGIFQKLDSNGTDLGLVTVSEGEINNLQMIY